MRIAMLISALLFTLAVSAQVNFKTTQHSFGKIPQSKPVTHIFTFTNTGAKPLVIENANAECGCTTPEYPKNAILKGQSGKIKVTYNAANMGAFTKKVHVKFANIDAPIDLKIEGEVIKNPKKS